MDKFELGIAVQKVYDFIWDEFCDWYIEMVKPRIYQKAGDGNASEPELPASVNAALWTLKTVLAQALKLLHPYMPFVTEEIFCTLQSEEETIMRSRWPEYQEAWNYPDEEEMIEKAKEAVRGVRNLRAEMDVPPSKKAAMFVVCEDGKNRETFRALTADYAGLMGASRIQVQADKDGIAGDAVSVVTSCGVIYIPLEELVDFEKERERLSKEKARLEKELARSNGMLNNEKFMQKAPEEKIREEREKLEKYRQMMEQVSARLEQLK